MADFTTRRAFLRTMPLAAASVALSAPVAAAMPDADELPPGHMLFRLGDRSVRVDTNLLPEILIEAEPAGYRDRMITIVSSEPDPDPEAEYLVLHEGRLLVSRLVGGSTTDLPQAQAVRLGFLAAENRGGGLERWRWRVRVLGRVL